MSAWGDFSTSDTLLGVGRSDACAIGRSGESLESAILANHLVGCFAFRQH